MPASDYLAGLVFFLPTSAATLVGAWLLLARRYPQLRGSERAVAFGILAVAGVLTTHLVPGILGVLSRATVLAAAGLWVAVATLVPAVERGARPARAPDERLDGGQRALALAAVVMAALLALAVARDRLFLAPLAVDTLNFHLPTVISWIQGGSIWDIGVFLPQVAPGHYPNNGDVLLLAVVLPWSNDFLAHLALYPVWLLTGIAVYGLARELRAPREAAAVAAALLLVLPTVLIPALIAGYTDVLCLFGFAAGILFLVRHRRSGSTSELVLAGLALGIAFGTKWYGVSAVAVVLGVWAAAGLIDGLGRRTIARQGGALIALVAAAGGIWMLRNLIASGNPVFPVRVAPLGIEIFDAPVDVVRERAGSTIAGYLGQPGVWWSQILPQYREVLAMPGLLLLGGSIAAAAVLRRRGAQHVPAWPLVLLGLVAVGLLVFVYAITPYSAGGPEGRPLLVGSDARYLVPALVLAAALCAWVAARYPAGVGIFGALALVAVFDAAFQVGDSSLSGASLGLGDWFAAVAVGAALVALRPAWRAWSGSSWRHRRVPLALAALAGLLVVSIGGYEAQRRFNGVRYVQQDPVVDTILTAGSSLRVGLAGTWDNGIPPVLPAFGPRLDNRVAYIGREKGGFLRQHRSRAPFVEAMRGRRYDYVIVGNGIPPRDDPAAVRWAESAGYFELVRSERLTLLREPVGVAKR